MKHENFWIASELKRRTGLRKDQAGCGTVGPGVAVLTTIAGTIASLYITFATAQSLNENEKVEVGVLVGLPLSMVFGIAAGCVTHAP